MQESRGRHKTSVRGLNFRLQLVAESSGYRGALSGLDGNPRLDDFSLESRGYGEVVILRESTFQLLVRQGHHLRAVFRTVHPLLDLYPLPA